MNKVKELKIDSTLLATPAKLVNLINFEPKKISIEMENNTNNNKRYKNGGFYITINNLRGYFNFNNNRGILTMLFDDIINKISIIKYGKTFLKLLIEDRAN